MNCVDFKNVHLYIANAGLTDKPCKQCLGPQQIKGIINLKLFLCKQKRNFRKSNVFITNGFMIFVCDYSKSKHKPTAYR